MGCPSEWIFRGPRSTDKYGARSGTPNHRLLWRVWYYGWAMRVGSGAEKADARQRLIDFITGDFTSEGQQWGETLNTSHYQLWLLGMAGARYIARHYEDCEIVELTGKWFRRELYIYRLLQHEGHVYSPGSRSKEPTVELRDVVYAMLMGQPAARSLKRPNRPLTAGPNDPNSSWWSDVYNVGAWILRVLIRDGDTIGGTAGSEHLTEESVLRAPLHVYTKGEDFLSLFPKLVKGNSDALFWVARIKGKLMTSPYHNGEINRDLENPYPVPGDWTDAKLVVVPGVK